MQFDASIIKNAANNGGKIFYDTTGQDKITDVKLILQDDGSVTYSFNINNTGWSTPINTLLTTIAPNGVIYVNKGNVFIQGTLNGRLSVVAANNGTAGAGQVHITDDVKYNKNPLIDPTSTDMLGLIAEGYVQVDYNPSTGDLDLHASIYSQQDGLVIERYADYPSARNMNLIGGVIGQRVLPTAKYVWVGNNLVPTNGYSYVHRFDERFNKVVPPFFPLTDKYRVVAWKE